jgi:hypothetical protein
MFLILSTKVSGYNFKKFVTQEDHTINFHPILNMGIWKFTGNYPRAAFIEFYL